MKATFLKGSLLMEMRRDCGYQHVTDLKDHLTNAHRHKHHVKLPIKKIFILQPNMSIKSERVVSSFSRPRF